MQVGGRTGKIELASCLGLFDEPRLAFLSTLFDLRNKFSHNVRNSTLRIQDVVSQFQPGQQTAIWRKLARGYSKLPTMFDFSGKEMPSEELARQHPRFMLWISTMHLIRMAYQVKAWSEKTGGKRPPL